MTSDLASKEESSNWDTSQVEDALILYGRECQVEDDAHTSSRTVKL